MTADSKNDTPCELQHLGSLNTLRTSTTNIYMTPENETLSSDQLSQSMIEQASFSGDITPNNLESKSPSLTVVEIEKASSLTFEKEKNCCKQGKQIIVSK